MATTEAQPSTIYFNSEYRHGVDGKRRVQIPSKWRPVDAQNIEYTLVVWPKGVGNENCLLALPDEEMKALAAKLKVMPLSDPKAISLRRLIGKNSEQVFLDKAGRICLPEKMAQAAAITDEAVLIGLVNAFERWNPARYEAMSKVDEANSSEAFGLI